MSLHLCHTNLSLIFPYKIALLIGASSAKTIVYIWRPFSNEWFEGVSAVGNAIGLMMSFQVETTVLERSDVPAHFPQFRTAATLAHLAHCGKGPLYTLVGGRAWYEITDIREWLEHNKRYGPTIPKGTTTSPDDHNRQRSNNKRGRPTKSEQYQRRLANSQSANSP
jgi:hypothetical protein